MWDKWKRKIENFIWKEVEEEDTYEFIQQDSPDSVPDIKTKMMYQYPHNETFHIPQITESNRHRNQPKINTDIPAYLRKGKRIIETHHNPVKEPSDENHVQSEKKPFKRTDVPSPVYGFQSRKNKKEVDTVPAFLRKQSEPGKVNEATFENIVDVQEEKTTIHIPETTTSLPDARHDEAPTINLEESQHKSRQGRKLEERNVEPKRDQPNPGVYNVIMTPTDKKRYTNRQIDSKQQATHQELSNQIEDSSVPLHLLNDQEMKSHQNDQWILEQQQLLEKTLKYFHVRARVVNATQGPAVTRFEVHPELGVKVSKVKNLSDDLKLNMSAKDIRIEAPIPGKNTIGIEVPNPSSQMVSLQEIVGSEEFRTNSSPLTIALGLNIEGKPIVTNIQKMPHGLIAGATGSGKSVCINTILLSLIYKTSYEDVKFLLIDPKMVELSPYNGIPHLVAPVITDVKAATAALKWAVNEMEDRYERFVQEGVRDIERYNQKIKKQNRLHEKMPFIVIVIDELADLMMISPQDVEDSISRIAQKARACGIHLLLATQRPSVDVLTGLIKANIPTRIAFSVSSQVDSRTIIDTGGAEKLLGKGDMLFIENGSGKSVRLQGPFVSDEEIERVTGYVRQIAEPNYLFEQEALLKEFIADEEEDELLEEAIQFVFAHDSASTSLLQRHFKIGYNRAARLMDALENKGIISGQNGSKPRDVLITKTELEEILS